MSAAAKVSPIRPSPLLAPTLPVRIREFLAALDAHEAAAAATSAAEAAQLRAAGKRGQAETELHHLIGAGESVCMRVSPDETVTITAPARGTRGPLSIVRARIVREGAK